MHLKYTIRWCIFLYFLIYPDSQHEVATKKLMLWCYDSLCCYRALEKEHSESSYKMTFAIYLWSIQYHADSPFSQCLLSSISLRDWDHLFIQQKVRSQWQMKGTSACYRGQFFSRCTICPFCMLDVRFPEDPDNF